MPKVKKLGPITNVAEQAGVIALYLRLRHTQDTLSWQHQDEFRKVGLEMGFSSDENSPYRAFETGRDAFQCWKGLLKKVGSVPSARVLATHMHSIILETNLEPMQCSCNEWWYKGFRYIVNGPFSNEQTKLLVIEEFDKERRYFERLKHKHLLNSPDGRVARVRLPEEVRIEVWRRDGGKCARCGSRDRLEYDHIIPVSQGGSSTARNIELLCESCNRRKGADIK